MGKYDQYSIKQCPCMRLLRTFLLTQNIEIYSERDEDGWVNVACYHTIYETVLKKDANKELEDN